MATRFRSPIRTSVPMEGDRVLMPAGRAIVVMLLSFALAALLGATSLHRLAQRQPDGWLRDVAVDVTGPIDRVSHTLWLDRPRQWLASWTNHEDQPSGPPVLGSRAVAPPLPQPRPTPSVPPASDASDASTTTTTTPPAVLELRRVPTADDPLKIWMGGDSLMGNVSEAFAKYLGDDPRYNLSTDVQVSTGLSRPDVFDWGTELKQQMDKVNPDVVFLTFGGNDDQPLHDADGKFLSMFTDEWSAEYARRVGQVMDLVSDNGKRTVVWIGLPPERPDRLNQAKDTFNAAARAAAAVRRDVIYLDTAPLFGGPDSSYQDTVTKPDGSIVNARERDGVHLTHDGSDLLAPSLFDAIAAEWHLR